MDFSRAQRRLVEDARDEYLDAIQSALRLAGHEEADNYGDTDRMFELGEQIALEGRTVEIDELGGEG